MDGVEELIVTVTDKQFKRDVLVAVKERNSNNFTSQTTKIIRCKSLEVSLHIGNLPSIYTRVGLAWP